MSAALSLAGIASVVLVGAHPDDLEIGAGALLLSLAAARPGVSVQYVLLTGSPSRQGEARAAAADFLPGAALSFACYDLPDGRLPAQWGEVKRLLHEVGDGLAPDLVVGPWTGDAHQDHRLVAEQLPTVFRRPLILQYEIPKWDGDLGRPNLYLPLGEDVARRKAQLLAKHFPSQHHRGWWDEEVFLGLARLRGVECHANYAEAFHCAKASIDVSGAGPRRKPGRRPGR